MTEIELQNIDPVKLFKLLYKHAQPVRKWIKANNGSRADADDVLQDAMIAFYQMIHKPEFKLSVKPETLLFAIAKRIWLSQLRQNRHMLTGELTEGINPVEMDTLDFDNDWQYTQMEKTLVLLGDKCKELLELFYFKKKDMVEIAELLGFRNDKVAKAMKYKCLEKARILINAKQ